MVFFFWHLVFIQSTCFYCRNQIDCVQLKRILWKDFHQLFEATSICNFYHKHFNIRNLRIMPFAGLRFTKFCNPAKSLSLRQCWQQSRWEKDVLPMGSAFIHISLNLQWVLTWYPFSPICSLCSMKASHAHKIPP